MDEAIVEAYNKTNSLIVSRQYEEAIKCVDTFFKNNPGMKEDDFLGSELWIWRGEGLRRLGKFDEAIGSFKIGLDLIKPAINEVGLLGMSQAKKKITSPIYQ